MATMMQQIGLVAAGCQPWNLNMVASCGPSFAYCATLAVYIYEYNSNYGEYRLTSINASHTKTISCISWNLYNPDLFATAGSDGIICVWDVKVHKCTITRSKLGFTPKSIGWLPGKNCCDILAYCGISGPITLWNTTNNSISTIDSTNGFDSEICLFRFHHTDSTKFILGHVDGSLSIYISGKRNKHGLRPSEESSYKDDDPVLAAIWDPLSSDYLLVARNQTGIQLVDVKACTIITRFMMPSKMVSANTLSWVDSAPGMFLTGDRESGTLRLWSVSQSAPLESINLKSTGFHCLHVLDTIIKTTGTDVHTTSSLSSSHKDAFRNRFGSSGMANSYSVPPAKVVCTFGDGGIGLYNLQQRKWNFLREQGHIETVFDCKFKPSDPKLLATASFDGTVKIWSVNDLTTVHTTTGNEGVIYSIAWAPGDLNWIACGTRRRGIFVWDLDKSKIIRRFKEHGMHTIFCVAWNQRNSHRLASCSDDGNCIVRSMDGQVIRTYRHQPSAAFGCDWSLIDKDLLATGCSDGKVRVWDLSKKLDEPYRVLKGHELKVFHVRWNPLIRNMLCSGSDDHTIRVWEIETETCTAVLTGHTSAVRGLAWNYEIPYLLASGSWDSSLKLWDVRNAKCIDTIIDHGADIYGLTTHTLTPFTYATSSRDSTIRVWSLAPLTQILFLKVLSGEDCSSVITTPEMCMERDTSLKLAGSMSQQLMGQLGDKTQSDSIRLRWFSELFSSSRRLQNLWDLVCITRGQRESTVSKSYREGIIHVKHLTKYKASEAQEAEHSQAHKGAVGSGTRHRDKSLMHAAEVHLKLGNVQRHCEILIQLGQWERALALAPAVSKQFWANLVKRYAELLESENEQEAVTFHIASGHVREAVKFMTSKSSFQEGLLIAQSAREGNTPFPVAEAESNGEKSGSYDTCDDLVTNCCTELASRHYRNADPNRAAAIHLANDDTSSALDLLVRSNNLALCLCISRNLTGNFEATTVAAQLLARKCESLRRYDVAVKLLQTFDPTCSSSETKWNSLHALCARCEVVEEQVKLHHTIGFPSPLKCSERAATLMSEGCEKEALQFYLISDQPQLGLELGVKLLIEEMKDNQNWTVDSLLSNLSSAFCVKSSLLKLQSNKILRTKLLAVSAYVGTLLAFRRNYAGIVKPLCQHAKALVDSSLAFDPNFPLHSYFIQEELSLSLDFDNIFNMDNHRTQSDNDVLKRMRLRSGKEKVKCAIGEAVMDASDLPSHSDSHVSTISRKKICGAAYFLEDQRSVLSINEAFMWARCNQFSPTASGERLCPF